VLNNAKAMVVILALAMAVFFLARPLCLRFMSAEAFSRRRNLWLALTAIAFLSPVFWTYAVAAFLLLLWAASRDENPLALYALVTFTIPNASFQLPSVVVNQLFDLTQYRLLSLAILIPTIVRSAGTRSETGRARFSAVDVSLIAFVLLQLILFSPYESVTNTMRRAFLFAIDSIVVLYAFSRLDRESKIADVMACFWIACGIMAAIGVFEWARKWLLYTGLVETWGDANALAWLLRGDSLRAQAAAGHSINFGYILSIGLGFFMYLRSRSTSRLRNGISVGLLLAGIFVSGSRGAWVCAALVLLVFVLLRPDAGKRLVGAALAGAAAFGLMYVTPLKESVLDRLPFIGSADQGTVEYRQQLAETSWSLIQLHPFFGDPFVYLRMESLRQGQGIIDIINGYLFTALFSGIVGCALQVAVYALATYYALRRMSDVPRSEVDPRVLGAALLATMVASLVFVATAAFSTTMLVIAGLLMSYARLPYSRAAALPAAGAPVKSSLRPIGAR
jgi:hypothetical protein